MTTFHVSPFTSLVALVAISAAACQQTPLHDLGDRQAALALQPPAQEPAPPADFVSDFSGTWHGEAEDPLALQEPPLAYRFPSGSTSFTLQIAPDDQGTGTLQFGAGPGPTPATNPDVGYPFDPDFSILREGSNAAGDFPPTEGFEYSLDVVYSLKDFGAAGLSILDEYQFTEEHRVVGDRLILSFSSEQVFGSWCALQTAASCPSAQSIGNDGGGNCTLGDEAMDCQKATLCYREVCLCGTSGQCSANPLHQVRLTLRRDGVDGLVGLFSGAVFLNAGGFEQPLGAVRFTRATD